MRCPKCHYLSLDPEPRCKNCGYSFSLADPDLSMMPPAESVVPLPNLDLRTDAAPAPVVPSRPAPIGSIPTARPPAKRPEPPVRRLPEPAPVSAELPLFVKGLSSPPAAPATLAVDNPAPGEASSSSGPSAPVPTSRRSRPASTAPRKLGPLDRDLLQDLQRIEKQERREATESPVDDASEAEAAGAGQRLIAAAIDAGLLAGLSAALVWVTLRWCDLTPGEWGVLPIAPTVGFVALLVVGYLVMFTAAGGQTIGKMIARIRVVDDAPEHDGGLRLTTSRAMYRALLSVPSVLALGAGFVPALTSGARAFHDRVTHTRVVRA